MISIKFYKLYKGLTQIYQNFETFRKVQKTDLNRTHKKGLKFEAEVKACLLILVLQAQGTKEISYKEFLSLHTIVQNLSLDTCLSVDAPVVLIILPAIQLCLHSWTVQLIFHFHLGLQAIY